MIKITSKDILAIHELIIDATGGCKGVKDYGLLDSAINSAYQTFNNQEIYSTIEEKSARIGYGIISNHAFLDGNKRMGIVSMLTLLNINGIKLNCTDDDIIKLGFSLASGTADYNDLLKWINNNKITKQQDKINETLEM